MLLIEDFGVCHPIRRVLDPFRRVEPLDSQVHPSRLTGDVGADAKAVKWGWQVLKFLPRGQLYPVHVPTAPVAGLRDERSSRAAGDRADDAVTVVVDVVGKQLAITRDSCVPTMTVAPLSGQIDVDRCD